MREYTLKAIAYGYVGIFLIVLLGGGLNLLQSIWRGGISQWLMKEGWFVLPVGIGLYYLGFIIPGVHVDEFLFGCTEKQNQRLDYSIYTACELCDKNYLGADLALCGTCSKLVCTVNCSHFRKYSLGDHKKMSEPKFFCRECLSDQKWSST